MTHTMPAQVSTDGQAVKVDDSHAAERLLAGLNDLFSPWALRAVATLGIADIIASGVHDLPTLASRSGADQDALGRLLRYLVCRGVFRENIPDEFQLTGAACLLLTGHPSGMRARLHNDGAGIRMDQAYANLLDSILTGEACYPKVHGRPFWDDLAERPRLTSSFDTIMAGQYASHWAAEIAARYEWTQVGQVVDVGGGTGTLLTAIATRHPHLDAILVEQPNTAATARKNFADAGLADRCTAVDGSFFEALPSGADVYLLSQIVHDWDDQDAVMILRRCAEAAGRGGRVLLFERVLCAAQDERDSTLMDLHMLALFGSKERTVDQFQELVSRVGLVVSSALPVPGSTFWLLECTPVDGVPG